MLILIYNSKNSKIKKMNKIVKLELKNKKFNKGKKKLNSI